MISGDKNIYKQKNHERKIEFESEKFIHNLVFVTTLEHLLKGR
jgi:hypothetical protein